MASLPINGPAAPVTLPGAFPPMPAVARILGRFDRPTLESFLAVAVDLLDMLDGDADEEEPGDQEPGDQEASDGDDRDVSWAEWQSRGRHKNRLGIYTAHGEFAEEDDEEDDAGEEDDPAGVVAEDDANTITERGYLRLPTGTGPGCMISDDDGQPMQCDVPTLPVFTLEHNPFDDRRQPLGYSNLLTSFESNGQTVRSADSGNSHRRPAGLKLTPGVPV